MGDIAFVESATEATRMWHMRLGHLSEKGMKELHMRDLLPRVKKLHNWIVQILHNGETM